MGAQSLHAFQRSHRELPHQALNSSAPAKGELKIYLVYLSFHKEAEWFAGALKSDN